jgi:hypothetical protein
MQSKLNLRNIKSNFIFVIPNTLNQIQSTASRREGREE